MERIDTDERQKCTYLSVIYLIKCASENITFTSGGRARRRIKCVLNHGRVADRNPVASTDLNNVAHTAADFDDDGIVKWYYNLLYG